MIQVGSTVQNHNISFIAFHMKKKIEVIYDSVFGMKMAHLSLSQKTSDPYHSIDRSLDISRAEKVPWSEEHDHHIHNIIHLRWRRSGVKQNILLPCIRH